MVGTRGSTGGGNQNQNQNPNQNQNQPLTTEDLVRLQTQTMQQLTQAIALMQQNLQNPPVQPPPQPIRDRRGEFLKGRPPKFSRAKDPMEAEDWIKAVERQLDIAQCDDREKVLYASGQFEGAALDWWVAYQYAQPDRNQITWQQFSEAFRAHHVPEGLTVLKRREFLALTQEGMSVTAYRDKFLELARYAPDEVSTDEKRQTRFRNGLQDVLQLQLMCITFPTFGALVDGALMVEHKRREIEDKKRKFMNQQSGSNIRPRYNPQQVNQQRTQGQSSLQNRSQNQQRPQYAPPQQQQQRYQNVQQNTQASRTTQANTTPVGPRVCYHCGEQGHYANFCPRRVQNSTGQNNNQKAGPQQTQNGNQQQAQGNRGQQNYARGKLNHVGAETAEVATDVVVGESLTYGSFEKGVIPPPIRPDERALFVQSCSQHPLLRRTRDRQEPYEAEAPRGSALQREGRLASRALEMRPFGEAKCLEDGPDAAERRPRSGFPRAGGQETAISRHITTYRQHRRDPGR
nr:unnamed protein product [Digitaria exilis]